MDKGKMLPHIACRLLEELVPFMDHSINDPAALRMSGSQHRRKQPGSKVCHHWACREGM